MGLLQNNDIDIYTESNTKVNKLLRYVYFLARIFYDKNDIFDMLCDDYNFQNYGAVLKEDYEDVILYGNLREQFNLLCKFINNYNGISIISNVFSRIIMNNLHINDNFLDTLLKINIDMNYDMMCKNFLKIINNDENNIDNYVYDKITGSIYFPFEEDSYIMSSRINNVRIVRNINDIKKWDDDNENMYDSFDKKISYRELKFLKLYRPKDIGMRLYDVLHDSGISHAIYILSKYFNYSVDEQTIMLFELKEWLVGTKCNNILNIENSFWDIK